MTSVVVNIMIFYDKPLDFDALYVQTNPKYWQIPSGKRLHNELENHHF